MSDSPNFVIQSTTDPLFSTEPYWGFDGPQMSGFCVNDSFGATIVGCVMKSLDEWIAFDNREANEHHTEAKKLGSRTTRDEAKKLVEEAFKPTEPQAGNPEPSRDFSSELRARVRELTLRPDDKNSSEKCGDSSKVEG